MTAPVIDFPTQADPPAPDCTCSDRDAERQRDGEVALADWIANPVTAAADQWLVVCPRCSGVTAEQRREALHIAITAAKAAERAVDAVAAAQTRARNLIAQANSISENARRLGTQGTPPRLTAPPGV